MIGLGKWKLSVAIPMLKADPILTISDKDGNYEFTVDVQGFGITPALNLINVEEENGDTLRVKAQIPMLNLGQISALIRFSGAYCTGEAEIPMLGKITVKGERVG